MADGARDDVLGRKAQAAQRAFEARGMSPTKAVRRALSRTADVLWDLALVTQECTLDVVDQDGLVDALGEKDLIILLDGPDGAMGIACIGREVLTGVVEVQTIQQVTQLPVDEDRVLTPTDAAMMAPLLDGAIEQLTANLHDHPLEYQVSGYRFGAMLEDARTTSLLLDAASYRAFRAQADLALGRRKGWITLFFPDRKPARGGETDQSGSGPGPHEDLLGRVPARLDAVLTRVVMPLNEAEGLRVGDVLPLSPDALDNVEVFAGKTQLVARGRLGQSSGMRAVRLSWPARSDADSLVSATQDAEAFGESEADQSLPDLSQNVDIEPMVDLPEPNIELDSGPEFTVDDFANDDAMGDPLPETEEALPDLPSLDFESEAAAFDLGEFDEPFDTGGDLPDIGLDAAFEQPATADFDK
ncbi:MAG: FliM/FliN family flagellar motor C-terminal domain-containing protein [Pelagimonas sp.]|jgi:flagellar motor switch protein FliM|nr:FliM/FliN family flagellar motor C-terminal domain-containing protein [Pelagimonas sp.]